MVTESQEGIFSNLTRIYGLYSLYTGLTEREDNNVKGKAEMGLGVGLGVGPGYSKLDIDT